MMRAERQNAVAVPEPIWMTSRMHENQAYASIRLSRVHFVIFGHVSHLALRGNNTRVHCAKCRYLTCIPNNVAPRKAQSSESLDLRRSISTLERAQNVRLNLYASCIFRKTIPLLVCDF